MSTDTAFQLAVSNIRFGTGITREVGMDLAELGVRRVMLVIDPALVDLPTSAAVVEALRASHVDYVLYDQVRVEPTDAGFQGAAKFAVAEKVEAFVAVGGGSTIDTAKAANLYATYPADFLEYVNAPIGRGKPVPEIRRSRARRHPATASSGKRNDRCGDLRHG